MSTGALEVPQKRVSKKDMALKDKGKESVKTKATHSIRLGVPNTPAGVSAGRVCGCFSGAA
jgi:hypothetical protein